MLNVKLIKYLTDLWNSIKMFKLLKCSWETADRHVYYYNLNYRQRETCQEKFENHSFKTSDF